jgi:hypothetical protein
MKTSQHLGRGSRGNLEIHPLNSECWVGDLEVEFVTTFLGRLPGLSCRWTSSAGRGTGLSRIELEESYSDQILTSL